jgi:photosystem II stability/assembly factor-like uncharacterized protein
MKNLTFFFFFSLFFFHSSFAQQYGWVDISNNLPNSAGTVTLPNMHWISDNEGWICSGIVGEIYHTTDGGQTFTIQTTQYYTNAVYMFNSLAGYSGGAEGRIYKTSNGGTTWVVHGSIGEPLRDIDFPPDSDTGYCSGDKGKIYKINPSGVSSMYTGLNSNLKSISVPTKSQGWSCGGTIVVHYTGITWITDQVYPSETYNAICMINNTTGWTVGDGGVLIKTTDGHNWNYQTNPDPSNRTLNEVFFLNVNEGWAIGDGGVILHTTNGGSLWTIEAAGMTTNMLRAIQFTTPTNGYLLGNNKTLLKYTLLTGLDQSASLLDFTLEQNHPNPFTASTTISWQSAKSNRQTLKVYDVFGNEVATLVDENKPVGRQSIDFETKGLPAGIYFYQLQANGRIETRKMVLYR